MGKGASTDIVLSSTFEVFCAGRKDEDSPAARIKNNVLIFMVYNNWICKGNHFCLQIDCMNVLIDGFLYEFLGIRTFV